MKRSGPISRHTPLRPGSKALTRETKLAPVNRKRAAKKSARNFGPHADFVRQQACAVTNCAAKDIQAAHVTCRGMGGANGGWWDLVPLCSTHHREQEGCLEEFQEAYEVDLRELAVDLVGKDFPRLRQLGVISKEEDGLRNPIGLKHVLAQLVRRLARLACRHRTAVSLNLTAGPPRNKEHRPMPDAKHYALAADQEMTLALNPRDHDGNVAQVQDVNWSTSDSSIVTLTPSADGLTCLLATTGKAGEATVTVSADADLGSGVTTISETATFTISPEIAESLNLSASAPISRPATTPAAEAPVIETSQEVSPAQ